MPDVKEVYEMVTKQKPSDPGALERQRTRQIRTMRNRKIGAFVVVSAMAVVAVAVLLAVRDERPPTNVGTDVRPSAKDAAIGFIEAYGSLDAEGVMTYLADDAELSSLIEWFGPQGGEGPLDELRLLFSLLDAQRYQLMLNSCDEVGSSPAVTSLRCTYAFHSLGSDEIGRGPFPGSYFDLIVRDGKVAYVGPSYMEIGEFSPQMWEPFASWVSTNHPDDAAVMYTDESQTLERVTRESIRLWNRNVGRYVEAVQRGDAA
jgi:hypothetical protein